jgi:hypothetical protein
MTTAVASPSPRRRAAKRVKAVALPDVAAKTWFGAADLIFLVFSLGILQRARGSMLDDPGLGWHLRNIDAMLAHGGWLTHDPFTVPLADWPWRTNVWLGDLWLWLGWHWGGLNGIAVFTTIVIALTCRWMYGMMVRDGVAWPVAAFWTLLGGLGTSISWTARPNIFSVPLLMYTAWICDRYHRGKATRRETLWLLPLFVLWANLHGGFPAGIVTIGVALVVEVALALGIPHSRNRQGARERAKHFAALLVGCLAATCANPYGWTMYPWIFQLLGNDYFMNNNLEWHSPDFHALGAMRYELFILVLPLILAVSKRRPSFVALAISIAWLHAALSGQRYIALWVVVTVPLVARLSMSIPWFADMAARCQITPELRTFITTPPRPSRWVATAAIALALACWSRASGSFAAISPHRIPTQALDELVKRGEGKVIFHHYNWGGYITWRGWPKVRNWIDDRNEVHGQAHIEEYFAMIDARGAWREKLDRYNVSLVCVPPYKAMADRLAEDAAWREVYRDDYAVIYERR